LNETSACASISLIWLNFLLIWLVILVLTPFCLWASTITSVECREIHVSPAANCCVKYFSEHKSMYYETVPAPSSKCIPNMPSTISQSGSRERIRTERISKTLQFAGWVLNGQKKYESLLCHARVGNFFHISERGQTCLTLYLKLRIDYFKNLNNLQEGW
jgi:hypothetical protein